MRTLSRTVIALLTALLILCSAVSPATLLEIGDNSVIGGGAIINGHIVERGQLILKKVKIDKNVTIGSHSTILPGCEIGYGAVIGASAVLLKDTKVGRREIWFGIPAEPRRKRERHGDQPDAGSGTIGDRA